MKFLEAILKTCRTSFVMSYIVIIKVLCLTGILMFSVANAQNWNTTSDGTFEVFTSARADDAHLNDVFTILREAKQDLRLSWGLSLSTDIDTSIEIYIHPSLESYHNATQLPWYVAAIADREEQRIDMQRLKVLLERNSLEKTLRHELYHLVQEDGLERWQSEGRAMIFAGEEPIADALDAFDMTDASDVAELNHILEGVLDTVGTGGVARADYLRATATAYLWSQRELASKEQ